MKSTKHINEATLTVTQAALDASDNIPEAATLLLAVAHNMLASMYGAEKANQWLLTQALAAPQPNGGNSNKDSAPLH